MWSSTTIIGGKLVFVTSFFHPIYAHLAKIELEREGMYVFLMDEYLMSHIPRFGAALGGVKLLVPQDQSKLARKIMGKEHLGQGVWLRNAASDGKPLIRKLVIAYVVLQLVSLVSVLGWMVSDLW